MNDFRHIADYLMSLDHHGNPPIAPSGLPTAIDEAVLTPEPSVVGRPHGGNASYPNSSRIAVILLLALFGFLLCLLLFITFSLPFLFSFSVLFSLSSSLSSLISSLFSLLSSLLWSISCIFRLLLPWVFSVLFYYLVAICWIWNFVDIIQNDRGYVYLLEDIAMLVLGCTVLFRCYLFGFGCD